MIRLLAAMILSVVTSAAHAQVNVDRVLPALFDVSGVAGNDVLNVRSGPGAGFEVIGALDPHAKGVEVVATNEAHSWGMIAFQGQTGWVAMRFMRVQDAQDAEAFPRRISCSGTEPFWSIAFQPGNLVVLDRPDQGQDLLTLGWVGLSRNTYISSYGFEVGGATISATGTIRRQMCSDGMSDITYGWAIDMVAEEQGQRELWSGCCSLQPTQ